MEKRNGNATYFELFSIATAVDFQLRGLKTALEVTKALSESDQMEMGLTRLSSYIHLQRTGDVAAANSLLALRVPGSLTDVAPKWQLEEASLHSQSEYKRQIRGRAQHGGPQQPGGKGAGKAGKGKKGKGAKGSATPG